MTDGGRFGGANVTVPLPGGCQCPGTPHEADEVYLLPRLTFDGGAAADDVIRSMPTTINREGVEVLDAALLTRSLCRAYLEHQVAGWNLTGEDGMGLPFSPSMLLSSWDTARAVGDAADAIYSEGLIAPLVAAVSKSSPGGPTAPSTSARTPAASSRRKR